MHKHVQAVLFSMLFSTAAVAADGVISLESSHDVVTTANKLESVLKAKGMTVFARINHADGAEKAGLTLRPTEVILFGNPKVGTPLMNCTQSVAIDLPQKALIHQDESGTVWYSYNDPAYLVERHAISGCEGVLKKISGALAKFAKVATQ